MKSLKTVLSGTSTSSNRFPLNSRRIERVAYDEAQLNQHPHLVMGEIQRRTIIQKRKISKKYLNFICGPQVTFAYLGLNPEARYQAKIEFFSDALRRIEMKANEVSLIKTLHLKKDLLVVQTVDIPKSAYATGRLELSFVQKHGPNAIVSAIEILSSDATPLTALPDPSRPIPRLSPIPASVDKCANPIFNLEGVWKFNPTPRVKFQSETTNLKSIDSSWSEIQVPGEWAMQGFNVKPNTAAGYFRTFTLPKDWAGKSIKLRADAIYSDVVVYINGKAAGQHSGGFTPFELEITDLVVLGVENVITLSVTNESASDTLASGSKYACHQLGGILRKIRLVAFPKTHITSLHVTTPFDKAFVNATLSVALEINQETVQASDLIEISIELMDPNGCPVKLSSKSAPLNRPQCSLFIPIKNPMQWNNECPHLYTLTIHLIIKERIVQTIVQRVGFREIKIQGNQLLVNGSPVKLRGINRHDVYPITGRSIPHELHRRDVEIFREGNVNLLRTCHYPPDEALLNAADELGMFVECEAPFCWAPGNGHAELVCQLTAEMVVAYRNHPSVLFWSIANESSWGNHFMASSRLIKKLDPTRPQTFNWIPKGMEEVGNCPKIRTDDEEFAAIANIHYPALSGVEQARRYTKRPVYLGEECHLNAYNRRELATDPSVRDLWNRYLQKMWNEIYRTDGSLGMSIWAGIDDTFYIGRDLTVGYGTWGPLDGWRREKPEFWGMKKTYSPIYLNENAAVKCSSKGEIAIPIENRNNFLNLSEFKIEWKLGRLVGTARANVPANQQGQLLIKMGAIPESNEKLELTFTDPRRFIADRFLLRFENLNEVKAKKPFSGVKACELKESKSIITIKANDQSWCIDKKIGQLISSNDLTMSGPQLMLLPLNSEGETQMTGKTKTWEPFTESCNGWICKRVTTTQKNKSVTVIIEGSYDNARGSYCLTFTPDGELSISYDFVMLKPLDPRQTGLVFKLPQDCETLTWERNGDWSIYPEDHIARLNGTVSASEGFEATSVGPRTLPTHPWRLDNLPYGNNDFCSTKHQVISASITNRRRKGITINGRGKQHVRCWQKEKNVYLLVADYSNGGGDRFLVGYLKKDRKPLTPGNHISGRVNLNSHHSS